MKFSIQREVLLSALQSVSRGLSYKTPMPVLTGIKVELTSDTLVMTTTNREISVQVVLSANEDVVIHEIGTCIIPGKYFIEIVKKIEGKVIEFTLFEETTIKIISERSNFTLIALEKSNFPKINFDVFGEPVEFTTKDLKKVIKQTSFAAGTSESRITLTGVCFDVKETTLSVTATDSYRLAKKVLTIDKAQKDLRINIPSKAVEELAKILEDDDEKVNLYVISGKAHFTYKNISFITRLIEGNFPDTSSLFPKEHLAEVTFNKNELITTVDRAALFTNMDNSSIVKMIINSEGNIQIASNSNEIGKVVDEIIPLKTTSLTQFQIAFSAKYFIEALRSFDSSKVIIKFTGEIKPFVLESEEDPGTLQLILPVRIF